MGILTECGYSFTTTTTRHESVHDVKEKPSHIAWTMTAICGRPRRAPTRRRHASCMFGNNIIADSGRFQEPEGLLQPSLRQGSSDIHDTTVQSGRLVHTMHVNIHDELSLSASGRTTVIDMDSVDGGRHTVPFYKGRTLPCAFWCLIRRA